MKTILRVPEDGLKGLKMHWRNDAVSGFLVFLIAMPLCLAISKASGFPPIAGIYTAIIGGIIVSFFMGGRLTIKGPAAGLIAIAVGAVEELGKGDAFKGYQLTLAIVVIAALIQIGFGLFKAGRFGDFFPLPAVHGMLAAIGLIIIAKQFPVLLGAKATGQSPLELLVEIPYLISGMNPEVALIGVVSLSILFLLPPGKSRFTRIIPPSLIVLLVAIPMAAVFDFANEHDYSLGDISYHIIPRNLLVMLPDSFLGGITFPDFSEIFTLASAKYVVMFSLVGSLESLLSTKAIDILDPYKRKSDMNKDMLSVGVGNLIAGAVGGLPMISEIVRSSANINNGAKTRWSNFFHGLFLLVFVTLAADVIRMIPNAALAAMLIYTGYRLSSPREFQKTWAIGWDQLIVFVATIIITLATDLLIGMFAGIAVQCLLHISHGVPLKELFKSEYEIKEQGETYHIHVRNAAVFSNYLGFRRCFERIEPGKRVVFNFAESNVIDHTLLEHLHHFEEEYHNRGGVVVVQGMNHHKAHSAHPLATRIIPKRRTGRIEYRLNNRQMLLKDFADKNEFLFYPGVIRNMIKYKDFPLEKGNRILYEENILSKYTDFGKVEVSDITLTEGAGVAQRDTRITIVHVSDLECTLPDFALEPEHLWTKLSELSSGKDIDFKEHEVFSSRYYLRGENESAIRKCFHADLIHYLEQQEAIHIESHRNKLLFWQYRGKMSPEEIMLMLNFIDGFIRVIQARVIQTR